MITRDQFFAGGRHVVTAVGSIAVTLGVVKSVDVQTVVQVLDLANETVKQIGVMAGMLMGVWASIQAGRSAAPASQVAKVMAMEPQVVVDQAMKIAPEKIVNQAAMQAPLAANSVLVVGAEGTGLPAGAYRYLDRRLTIPMRAPVDSLNAAVATALLLYSPALRRL